MSRARRRRANRRSVVPTLLTVVAVALVLFLVVASFAEIPARSSAYRTSTNRSFASLAAGVVSESDATGARLAQVMTLVPSTVLPVVDRAHLQQALDQAAREAAAQAQAGALLVPPQPDASVGPRLAAVLADRSTAVANLRSTVDGLLGMSPAPVAGAPPTGGPAQAANLISTDDAVTQMTNEGSLIVLADTRYASLSAVLRRKSGGARLPVSVWAPAPVATAALGPQALGAAATSLASMPALAAYHKVIVSAVGLTPAAVPTGSPGIAGTGCDDPSSTVPSGPATLLPPTSTVQAQVTVTNCGTVAESHLTVSATLVTVTPPPGRSTGTGGTTATSQAVQLAPLSSTGVSLAPLPVRGGGTYTLTVAVTTPADQILASGSSQRFTLQVAS